MRNSVGVFYDFDSESFKSNSLSSSSKPSKSSSRKRFSLNGVASTTSPLASFEAAASSSPLGSSFFKRSSVAIVPVPSTYVY